MHRWRADAMIQDLTRRIVEFRDERDWKQYHSPRNLAASITIEAAELLEVFQWSSDEGLAEDVEANRSDLERELADILIYCLLLAHDTGVNPVAAIEAKLAENAEKYPPEKARGRREKYTQL
jgi:NTP pyrophosphatase (non-canonical NTP hydrolase)